LNYTRAGEHEDTGPLWGPVGRPDIVPETTAVSIAPRIDVGRWTYGTVRNTGSFGWSTGRRWVTTATSQ